MTAIPSTGRVLRSNVPRGQAVYPVQTMARLMGVSRSGFYAWQQRTPSDRAVADAALSARIAKIHGLSKQTYGAPRIHAELADVGINVGRKRVERLMKAAALAGVSRRKGTRTTFRDDRVRPANDPVDRNFRADEPNQLWGEPCPPLVRGQWRATLPMFRPGLASSTCLSSQTPGRALAIVLGPMADMARRGVVDGPRSQGATRHRRHEHGDPLPGRASHSDVPRGGQRRPANVIHHSDQGSQYTSLAFGLRCKEAGVRPSMGSVGDAYDNAMCESFFATSNANCSTGASSAPRLRPVWRSSSSSRAGTIRRAATRLSAINPPSRSKGARATSYDPLLAKCPRNRGNSNSI